MDQDTDSRSADAEYLVRDAMTTGYQISSLLAPTLYLAYAFSSRGRGSFTINRLLRATWVGGLGGTAITGGLAYSWYSTCNKDALRSKHIKAAYNADKIRADDHATIGAVLTSVLATGVFWKRAGVVNLILGGAGLGSTVGLLTHYGRSLSGDPPQKAPRPTAIDP